MSIVFVHCSKKQIEGRKEKLNEIKEKTEKVRVLLTKHCLTNKWLVHELERQSFDILGTELSDIYNGRRKGPKAVKALDLSLQILERYENCYVNADK